MGNSPKGEYMLNKINVCKLIGIGGLCLFLLGCSEESFLVQENVSGMTMEENSEKGLEGDNIAAWNQETDVAEEQNVLPETQEDSTEDTHKKEAVREIAVHVCGAVNQPGVYFLQESQRLYEAIAKAGGFREDADEDYLNQALILEDGMKITVPTMEETTEENEAGEAAVNKETVSLSELVMSSQEAETEALEKGYLQKQEEIDKNRKTEQRIDLNTADEALLCTLPGIGESRAKSIIAYRQEHGPFRSPEDVMMISGIKEAAYNKIKDYIMVSE